MDQRTGNRRPIPLHFFEKLLPEINIYIIQKSLVPNDLNFIRNHPEIRYLGDQIRDFADSAAIIDCLDAVVSVDSALAHLAGALGKRSFVLLSKVADWRWFLDDDRSPWYSGMTLLRQQEQGNWSTVIKELKDRLFIN